MNYSQKFENFTKEVDKFINFLKKEKPNNWKNVPQLSKFKIREVKYDIKT